jgi:hypothetical protein
MRRDIFAYVHLFCYICAMVAIALMFHKFAKVFKAITIPLGG